MPIPPLKRASALPCYTQRHKSAAFVRCFVARYSESSRITYTLRFLRSGRLASNKLATTYVAVYSYEIKNVKSRLAVTHQLKLREIVV
jgi:hypothetical protein